MEKRPVSIFNRLYHKLWIVVTLLIASGALYASNDVRLSASELHQKLNQPGLLILDSRSPQEYQLGHLPGALNLPETWTYHNIETDGRIVQPAKIQTILRSLGIDVDTQVVIYDNGEMIKAARAFWTLEVYGLNQVKVLNQGYRSWLKNEFTVAKQTPQAQPSNYIPVINHQRLATKLTTLIASKNPNQTIVDARDEEAYLGHVSTAKRFGHIPNALNIPASHNLNSTEQMKGLAAKAKLDGLYTTLPKQNKIILYCDIGRASATNYLALRELGYNVSNYDGSWKEWGNDLKLPIEK